MVTFGIEINSPYYFFYVKYRCKIYCRFIIDSNLPVNREEKLFEVKVERERKRRNKLIKADIQRQQQHAKIRYFLLCRLFSLFMISASEISEEFMDNTFLNNNEYAMTKKKENSMKIQDEQWVCTDQKENICLNYIGNYILFNWNIYCLQISQMNKLAHSYIMLARNRIEKNRKKAYLSVSSIRVALAYFLVSHQCLLVDIAFLFLSSLTYVQAG